MSHQQKPDRLWCSSTTVKLAFHDTDTDILARILADTPDTRDFLKLFPWQTERHAEILATILARMSVSVSVSASWNANLTALRAMFIACVYTNVARDFAAAKRTAKLSHFHELSAVLRQITRNLAVRDILSMYSYASVLLLGPFYGAIAVPSVTRCRCRCVHRFYFSIHQVSLLSHAACAIAIAGFGSSW